MSIALTWPVHASVAAKAKSPATGVKRRWSVLGLTRIHEAIQCRPTIRLAQSLEVSQWRSQGELRRLQSDKLRRILAHALERCPYYRRRWLMSDQSSHRMDGLASWPLLSRAELRAWVPALRWVGMPGRMLVDRTHGTTDDPLTYYWDRRRQAWDKANRIRGHAWHGLTFRDPELHLWPLDPPRSRVARGKAWLRSGRDRRLGELQIDSLGAFRENLAASWRRWRQFDPLRVTAYPSTLARFIVEGRRAGCALRRGSLRRVFLTGEVTFDWQRRLVEHELGVETSQVYGLQEVGALAFACELGRWHVSAESAFIEFLNNGRHAQPGELAEVVVTTLESRAMPLVRYCTGDIVRVAESACPCNRGLAVMPPVLGRSTDFLLAEDGRWIAPSEVVASLGHVLEDGSFQVVQSVGGEIEVRVEARVFPRRCRHPEILRRVARLVGDGADCTIRQTSALSRSVFGKCRYVSSQRTTGGLARPADALTGALCRQTQVPAILVGSRPPG